MMKKTWTNTVCLGLVSVSTLSSCASNQLLNESLPESKPGKIYKIAGTHSAYGPYHGELELRALPDGNVEATRVIKYDVLKFEDNKVREVWSTRKARVSRPSPSGSSSSGLGLSGPARLDSEFKLKRADFLLSVDKDQRTLSQFKDAAVVSYAVPLDHGVSQIKIPGGVLDEHVDYLRESDLEPIWKDERQILPAYGKKNEFIAQLANLTLFLPVVSAVRADPYYKSFENRPEYKSQMQYCILDKTDFDYLRKNKQSLSLNNKVLDPISLVEASLRRRAYAPTLEEKARLFEEDMKNNHINELGLFSGAAFDGNSRVAFTPNGDGALWSGMYAGAEAMRYLATKDPDALSNYKRVTRGLMLLMDVTGNPAEFGRTAHSIEPGESLGPHWEKGVAPYEGIKYIKIGNNDMIKGLFHSFAWAYEILPEDDPFLAEVSAHARRLPQLRISHEKVHPGNRFCAAGLAALGSAKDEDLLKFLAVYEGIMQPVGLLRLDEGFYAGGMGDWSGVNLIMVSQVSEIIIAKNLARKFRQSAPWAAPFLDECVGHLRQKLFETWATYADVRRDFMTIAADAFSSGNNKVMNFPDGTTPANWGRKESWPLVREQSVWGLREFPVPDYKHSVSFNFMLKPDWCMSAWLHLPWKSLVEPKPLAFYYQGVYNYPLFEGQALDTDNAWTSAFQYAGGSSPKHRNGRIDFLHVYWMGRLSGLIDSKS